MNNFNKYSISSQPLPINSLHSREQVENRNKKYSKAKIHNLSMVKHLIDHEPLMVKEMYALKECGNFLIYRHYNKIDLFKFIAGCSCKKHLLCMLCAVRRAARTVQTYLRKIDFLMKENPDLIPILITFTVKNGDDLEERFNHLKNNIARLNQKRRNSLVKERKQKTHTIFSHIQAAAGSYEFKKGSGSGLWHPHLHLIAFIPRGVFSPALIKIKNEKVMVYPKLQKELSQEWQDLTLDSKIVDVRALSFNSQEDKIKAVSEVFKYALKMGDLDPADQVHAYHTLKTKRLVTGIGDLYNIKMPHELHDDIEEELKLQPYIDVVFKFVKDKYQFSHNTDLGELNSEIDKTLSDSQMDKSIKQNSRKSKYCLPDLSVMKKFLSRESTRSLPRKKIYGNSRTTDPPF